MGGALGRLAVFDHPVKGTANRGKRKTWPTPATTGWISSKPHNATRAYSIIPNKHLMKATSQSSPSPRDIVGCSISGAFSIWSGKSSNEDKVNRLTPQTPARQTPILISNQAGKLINDVAHRKAGKLVKSPIKKATICVISKSVLLILVIIPLCANW
jgi:hypothetical protein